MTTRYRLAIIAVLLVGAVSALVLPGIAGAVTAGLGAAPSSLTYVDVLPGGSSQKQVQVYNFSGEPSQISVSQTGQVAAWLKFSPSEGLPLPPASARVLTVEVQPPVGTAPGTYTGEILLVAKPTGRAISGGAGAEITAGTVLPVKVSVTGTATSGITLESAALDSITWGAPLLLQLKVANVGNVAAEASANIKIHTHIPDGNELVATLDRVLTELPAQTSSDVAVDIPYEDLEADLGYHAIVSLLLDGEEVGTASLPFMVAAPDTVPVIGIIKAIQVKPYAVVGEEVEVTALFDNTGDSTIQVAFHGYVRQAGTLVEEIEGAGANALPNTRASVKAYFVPELPGQYTIAGHVAYSAPLEGEHVDVSDEVEAFLEVFPPPPATEAAGWGTRDYAMLGGFAFLLAAVVSLAGYIWYNKRHSKVTA